MDSNNLEELITQLYGYFNRKAPNIKQIDLWATELDYIPSSTRRYIYNELRNDNPEKVAFKTESCDFCKGSGGLVFDLKGYDFLCRCGHCNNWRGSYGENAAAIYTTYEIQKMGGTVQG